MGDENDRASLGAEFGEEGEDGETGLGVEISRGFVGEDDFGVIDEGSGDGDALHLAAAELERGIFEAIGETDAIDGGESAGGAFGGGDPRVDHGELDILEDIEFGEEIKGLEDEADFGVAEFGEAIFGGLGGIDAIDDHASRGGGIEAPEEVHEGGLAAAAGADDGGVFALFDEEIDVVEGGDFLFTDAVAFGDSLERDEGHCGVEGSGIFGNFRGFGEEDFFTFLEAVEDLGVIEISDADGDGAFFGGEGGFDVNEALIFGAFEDGVDGDAEGIGGEAGGDIEGDRHAWAEAGVGFFDEGLDLEAFDIIFGGGDGGDEGEVSGEGFVFEGIGADEDGLIEGEARFVDLVDV